MRITFLQSSLWLSGGARVHVEFGNLLAARGHDVAIVIPRGAIDPEIAAAVGPDLKVMEAAVPLHRPADRRTSLWDQARIVLSMAASVPKSDIIIATHTPTTLVSGIAGHLLRRGPAAWFYMDYPGMFAGRRLEGWLLRHALRWHRGAMVISRHSAEELLTFSEGDVRYVGLALNDYAVFNRAREATPASRVGARQIMYLGDFRPRKGLADFIAASETVHAARPDTEFLIVLKEAGEITTNIPHRVVLRPDTETLASLYAQADLFVSASWYEGFGMPPLEAMACGTPVVLTDSGGVRDFARDGENCLVVPPQQPAALAEAVLKVLDDPSLALRLARSGPLSAAEFTWEKATDRLEASLTAFTQASKISRSGKGSDDPAA